MYFGGDHIYKMQVVQMLEFHKERQAHLSISAIPHSIEEASEFELWEVDEDWRLVNFVENQNTDQNQFRVDLICVLHLWKLYFDKEILLDALTRDAQMTDSSHDFGKCYSYAIE